MKRPGRSGPGVREGGRSKIEERAHAPRDSTGDADGCIGPAGPAIPDLTYLGSLDDKVQDHAWDFEPNIQVLNEQLIAQALFGNPLLLNDGYFARNGVVHKSLLDGPESIIGALAQEGFIKIYIRDQDSDLFKGIADAAKSGVEDHDRTLNDDEWDRRVRPYLEDLIPRMAWSGETWPDPATANVGRIFFKLLESRADRSREDLQLGLDPAVIHDTLEAFAKAADMESFKSARTVWEKRAIPAFLKNNPAFDPETTTRKLMTIANEAYHFAHAIAAESKFGARTCGVQTALSTAFADLVEQDDLPEGLKERHEDAGRYLFSMPRKMRISGSGLRHLMYRRAGIGLLKREYIEGLNAYLTGRTDDAEMERLFAAYRDELADHLSRYEHVANLKSDGFGYVTSMALSFIPFVGFFLSSAYSLGGSTVFRWFRKNVLASRLEQDRWDHMQNVPEEFRNGRQWRTSMMSVRVRNGARFLE